MKYIPTTLLWIKPTIHELRKEEAIFQQYYGKNKLHFDEIIIMKKKFNQWW